MGQLGRAIQKQRQRAGKQDRDRGSHNEDLVLLALRRDSRPWWLRSARPATTAEDYSSGVDIIVDDEQCGSLYLQVKSSSRQARKWRAERRKKHPNDKRLIETVVVPPDGDLAVVYGRALGALILLRERSGKLPPL